jgi:hypothetical protein
MKREQNKEARIVSCPPEVLILVERFEQNRGTYKSGYEKTALQHQNDAIDRQIDQSVYGLTEDEVEIVDGQ